MWNNWGTSPYTIFPVETCSLPVWKRKHSSSTRLKSIDHFYLLWGSELLGCTGTSYVDDDRDGVAGPYWPILCGWWWGWWMLFRARAQVWAMGVAGGWCRQPCCGCHCTRGGSAGPRVWHTMWPTNAIIMYIWNNDCIGYGETLLAASSHSHSQFISYSLLAVIQTMTCREWQNYCLQTLTCDRYTAALIAKWHIAYLYLLFVSWWN